MTAFQDNRTFLAKVGLGIANPPESGVSVLQNNFGQVNANPGYTEALIAVNADWTAWTQQAAWVVPNVTYAGANGYAYPKQVTTIQMSGQALYFAIDGSSAPVRLNLTIGNRTITNFGPGQILRTPFSRVDVSLSPESSMRGYARLLAIQDPNSFDERQLQQDRQCGRYRAARLTNDITFRTNAPASVAYAYGDTPVSLNMYSDFVTMSSTLSTNVKGWSHIRVGIVPANTGVMGTSFTLIPWFCWLTSPYATTDTKGWWQQLQSAVSVAYSGAAMGSQLVTLDLNGCYPDLDPTIYTPGAGIFFFPEIRDNVGGTVGYGFVVEGLS